MAGLSFKSSAFSLVVVCLLSASAVADTFPFTGDAIENAASMDFTLTGPSFFIQSSFNSGPSFITVCTTGTLCTIPPQDIPANDVAEFSVGTVGGVRADTLVGGLTFSPFSFTADPNVDGSGSVMVTGDLTGFVFDPPGCEVSVSCTGVGHQVFDLQISGSGTGTTIATTLPGEPFVVRVVDYKFSGNATTVPEPSSLLLLSSGLIGFAAIRRWHLLRRVNH
jgi:hypothetical protein